MRNLTQSHGKPTARNSSANSIYETHSKPDLVSHSSMSTEISSLKSATGFIQRGLF